VTSPRVVLMGVTGSGKTTVGRALARRLGAPFLDADDLHSADAKAAMHAGRPLDDAERAPWLVRLRDALRNLGDGPVVLACSALKRSYRDALRDGVPALTFVELDVDPATLEHRLEERTGHFAGPDLLPSQLATLELGDDIVRVDATGTLDEVVTRVERATRAGQLDDADSCDTAGSSGE
jgi:carbohydrate kinase (thermoresistant glucokinase family)